MKNKKIILAAAACWWLIVLAVMYWIENRLFGGVFECASVNLLVCSVVLAIVRFIEGPPDEWSKPVLPPFVMNIFYGIIVFSISYIMLKMVFKEGKWGLLLLIPEWFVFLLFIVLINLYKKRYGYEPSDAQMVFLLGLLLLLGLFITIQFSGICTVASMQTMLEENGYTQTVYKGEQSYLLLNALHGDAPAPGLADSGESAEKDPREIHTGLYLYSGWKEQVEYALFVSPVTGRIMAELPLEEYPAYEMILHGN